MQAGLCCFSLQLRRRKKNRDTLFIIYSLPKSRAPCPSPAPRSLTSKASPSLPPSLKDGRGIARHPQVSSFRRKKPRAVPDLSCVQVPDTACVFNTSKWVRAYTNPQVGGGSEGRGLPVLHGRRGYGTAGVQNGSGGSSGTPGVRYPSPLLQLPIPGHCEGHLLGRCFSLSSALCTCCRGSAKRRQRFPPGLVVRWFM